MAITNKSVNIVKETGGSGRIKSEKKLKLLNGEVDAKKAKIFDDWLLF